MGNVPTGGSVRRGILARFRRDSVAGLPADWRTQAPQSFELGRLLTDLGPDWTVLHAFDVFGDLDTDFLVVGPAGVFLITGRSRSGAAVWVDEGVLWENGRPTNHVAKARAAASRASARLTELAGETVTAVPILALASARSLTFGGDPARRVVTLAAENVTDWLTECSRTHPAHTVDLLSALAEDRATWRSPSNDSSRLARVR